MNTSAPQRGNTIVSERVVNTIVSQALETVPGSVKVDGSLAQRSYPRCDVSLEGSNDTVSVEAFIAVAWPSPVTDVALTAQKIIRLWVERMTGLQVSSVDIVTGPVVNSSGIITPALLKAACTPPKVTPVVVTPSCTISSPVITPHKEQIDVIRVEERIELTPIATNRAVEELTPIQVQPQASMVEITTAQPEPLRAIEVSGNSSTVTPIVTAPPTPLRKIRISQPPRVRTPHVPRPQPLKKVRVRAVSARPSWTAGKQRIRVHRTPVRPVKIYSSTQYGSTSLKPIVVRSRAVQHPQRKDVR